MGTDKTYFIEGGGASGGMDVAAMVSALMNNKGMDPNLVAALMNGNNNKGAFGGDGAWWIWIILLFFCFGGFGGNGFGNNSNGIPATLNSDAGREMLMNAIQGIGTDVSQLANTLGCSVQTLQSAICNTQNLIQSLGSQIGLSTQQIISSVQGLDARMASCCCDINTSIIRQGYENQLATCQQTNSLVNTSNQNTLTLRDGALANTQAILGKLDAMQNQALMDKLDREREKNSTLTTQLNLEHQTNAFQISQAQTIAPVVNGLNDLSNRLAQIECRQMPTFPMPYIPASGGYMPVSYGVNINPYAVAGASCGC